MLFKAFDKVVVKYYKQFMTVELILVIIASYLLGSIPFGLILTKIAGLGDIRTIGSKSIGATNVLRTGRKDLAIATLLLDGGKGAVAVLLAGYYGAQHGFAIMAETLAALAVVVGHVYPLWLKFKGGKAVATSLGIIFTFAPWLGCVYGATWLVVAFTTRYSSLSALVAFAVGPIVAWLTLDSPYALCLTLISLLVFFKHTANIKRLLRGEESKINLKRDKTPAPEKAA